MRSSSSSLILIYEREGECKRIHLEELYIYLISSGIKHQDYRRAIGSDKNLIDVLIRIICFFLQVANGKKKFAGRKRRNEQPKNKINR